MGQGTCIVKGTCKGKRPSLNGKMEKPVGNLEEGAPRA